MRPAADANPNKAQKSEAEFGVEVFGMDASSPQPSDAGASMLDDVDEDAGAPPAQTDAPRSTPHCARETLRQRADTYLDAMARGSTVELTVHPDVRYTENGQVQVLGLGAWLEQAETEFARHIVDEHRCTSVTEAVLDGHRGRVVFGARLRYVDGQLLEIETQVVHQNTSYFDPEQMIASSGDDWSELPESDRSTSDELLRTAMAYFDATSDASLLPEHEAGCVRRQNGTLLNDRGSCGVPPGNRRFEQLRPVAVDAATGVVAMVTRYNGYIGFYLIKQRASVIQVIDVIGGAQSQTTGW
jgi:hypothetical protein